MFLFGRAPLLDCLREGENMPDEKKSYYTESRKRANEKYLSEKVEDVRIRVLKGQKAVIKAHADKMHESMNQFVVRAITETISRDLATKEGEPHDSTPE